MKHGALSFKLENIKCEKFPGSCNKTTCIKFPCDEIRNQMVSEIIRVRNTDPYSLSDLPEWLEHDTWKVKDALLLMADISPTGAEVNWDGYENLFEVWIDAVQIINAQPLAEDDFFYITPFEEEDLKAFTKLGNEEVKEKINKLKQFQNQLNRIKRLWDSRESFGDGKTSPEERNPINYYLIWAEKKNIPVPWLDWAKRNELLNIDDEKSKPLVAKVATPFLETGHAFYAKELKIAVEAWTELYEKNPPQHTPKGGHKKYIAKWLAEKYSNLSQRARKRIATIINPNPKGGATPTNENF